MSRPSIRSLAGGAAGIAAGVLGGIGLTSASPGGVAEPAAPARLEAGHVPPVLTLPGEPVTLRYAIVCRAREADEPCAGSGEVYARAGQSGAFRAVALERGEDSAEGRYFVDLPREIASSRDGFSYYAVLRDDATGATVTVPSGGRAAPQRSLPLQEPLEVDLGPHAFGHTRPPDARVLEASWGRAAGELGLSGSRGLGFIGPSAFDVASDRSIAVLDQVNGRLQRWERGRVVTTPLALSGGLADIALEPDGSVDVLEPPDRANAAPVLRRFNRAGTLEWSQRLSDRTWAKLAVGPDGPVVQQEPSEQWLPAAADGAPLDRQNQARRGRPGRPFANGREIVLARVAARELRLAEVTGSAVVRSWRIGSSTPLGEVQLAEPFGNKLVVVVKTYTDGHGEFLALVLDRSGLVQRLSLDATQWAETAPLARFRLVASSLYRLGSTEQAAFVDRYDLQVSR
jgi:hypothetical protein